MDKKCNCTCGPFTRLTWDELYVLKRALIESSYEFATDEGYSGLLSVSGVLLDKVVEETKRRELAMDSHISKKRR